jgi:hypothetical protein
MNRGSRMPSTHVSKMDAIPGGELARPGGDLVRKTPGMRCTRIRRLAQRGARAFCCVLRKKITLMV